ncbi:hypothetical protein RHRU231_470081 [Rhodococcus ruber]|uniref:Uncharacterized protein n=1 Tax=Rhodococcus ruber TaxID=1830 RepID=A0A098BKK7_9NOCA|nr:hypothetical protein RHRU231_470081 [Rhodococcus ruber]
MIGGRDQAAGDGSMRGGDVLVASSAGAAVEEVSVVVSGGANSDGGADVVELGVVLSDGVVPGSVGSGTVGSGTLGRVPGNCHGRSVPGTSAGDSGRSLVVDSGVLGGVVVAGVVVDDSGTVGVG